MVVADELVHVTLVFPPLPNDVRMATAPRRRPPRDPRTSRDHLRPRTRSQLSPPRSFSTALSCLGHPCTHLTPAEPGSTHALPERTAIAVDLQHPLCARRYRRRVSRSGDGRRGRRRSGGRVRETIVAGMEGDQGRRDRSGERPVASCTRHSTTFHSPSTSVSFAQTISSIPARETRSVSNKSNSTRYHPLLVLFQIGSLRCTGGGHGSVRCER